MQSMFDHTCRFVCTLLLLLWFKPLFADISALDYLYESGMPGHAQELVNQAAAQIVNGETANARLTAEELKKLQNGSDDPGIRSRLLVNYGILMVAIGDTHDGAQALLDGMTALELNEGTLSGELVSGLTALGIGQISQGNISEGEQSLLRAQNLLHREAGVYASDQQGILYYLTMLALNQGDVVSADRLQRFSLLVAERSYGEDSPLIVPTLTRLGAYFGSRGGMLPVVTLGQLRPQHGFLGAQMCSWGIGDRPRPCNPGLEKWQSAQINQSRQASKVHTERHEHFNESIAYYERAMAIQQAFPEDVASSSFDTLRAMAKVYIQQGDYRDAEQVLFRATKLAEDESTADLEDRIEVILDLGDLLTVRSDSRAIDTYLMAWRLLQTQGQDGERYFKKPRRLVPGAYQSLALNTVPENAASEDGYFAVAKYDVNEKGRVEDIRIVESNVPGPQIRSLRMELLRSRFRPRIEAGQVVETRDLRIRFTYVVPEETQDI